MCDHPIDLSRRSDSVETRKTPSPSNSSSIETSPSIGNNDSPSSLQHRLKRTTAHKNRSDTPTNRYQTASFTTQNYLALNYTKHDRMTPSPPDSLQMHRHPAHYLHGASIPLMNSHSSDQAYYLNAQQRKLTNIPAKSGSSSPVENDTMEIDRKTVRPFKMYSQNPLTLAATIDTSDKYDRYRQQIFNQLYPNGDSTVGNPKMRRMSRKSFDGSEHSEMDYNGRHENDTLARQKQQNDAKIQSDSSSNCGTHENGLPKDKAYYERRRKNNAAAKKSRDRRRQKEDELAVRASFLERENMALRIELDALKKQLEHHAAVMAKH